MEFKGTKGKWKLSHDSMTIIDENELPISKQSGRVNLKNWEANALLISKAPEMLEMLNLLLEGKDSIPEWKKEKAKQLIKEATEL